VRSEKLKAAPPADEGARERFAKQNADKLLQEAGGMKPQTKHKYTHDAAFAVTAFFPTYADAAAVRILLPSALRRTEQSPRGRAHAMDFSFAETHLRRRSRRCRVPASPERGACAPRNIAEPRPSAFRRQRKMSELSKAAPQIRFHSITNFPP